MQKAKGRLQNFQDLVAWQKGHELVLQIYQTTREFPAEEKFGLVGQMRRSSTSITANIAEGFGRQGKQEKIQFYVIARGSDTELQDQLLVARDLKFFSEDRFIELMELATIVHKLINGLIKSVRLS